MALRQETRLLAKHVKHPVTIEHIVVNRVVKHFYDSQHLTDIHVDSQSIALVKPKSISNWHAVAHANTKLFCYFELEPVAIKYTILECILDAISVCFCKPVRFVFRVC